MNYHSFTSPVFFCSFLEATELVPFAALIAAWGTAW